MPVPPPITLDDGWTVEYFEQYPEPHELASAGQFVPSLRPFDDVRGAAGDVLRGL